MNDLKKLIMFIQEQYDFISEEWKNNENYFSINMKKIRVDHIFRSEQLLSYVFNYRNFLNIKMIEINEKISKLSISSVVSRRVKNTNSIQFKLEEYNKNHENGKIPIKKCLNDIMGFRIILKEDTNYNEIKKFINVNFPKLKCIDSTKDDYVAAHIYFGNDDNTKFQWELQIWDEKHEISNLESHHKHKQDYTQWEKDNEEGVK